MEITLEKIELVKDRTGVSYKEAKEALENANGSVVDAIISIEEDIDKITSSNFEAKGYALVDYLKDLVKKGNVSKIVVRNQSGEAIISVPINVGVVGAIISPVAMVLGAAAAFGFKCVIEVVKVDGTVLNVSEKASETAHRAYEKSNEVYSKVMNNETASKAVNVAGDAFDKAAETFKSKLSKSKIEDELDEVEDVAFEDLNFEELTKREEEEH